jgi:hypothetical protein
MKQLTNVVSEVLRWRREKTQVTVKKEEVEQEAKEDTGKHRNIDK